MRMMSVDKAKSFDISKQEVWEAYKRVKANRGAAGVDGVDIVLFDQNLSKNLYRIWNRMASGSYFPPPVRHVDIPKRDGGTRSLGVPTIADRIAQMVAKKRLEPVLDTIFHPDSYGYRPGRSAHDALRTARRRCWQHDWVLDLDIKGFFDNISHELLMRAVSKHTDCRWLLLYIKRWLQADICMPDGELKSRDKGTPQGGVVSPLLANLFLHYAFDSWIEREHPAISFERYADDIICHCDSLEQARSLKESLIMRLHDCGLSLHPEKTRIAYCADANRRGRYDTVQFDFLSYTFKPRQAVNRRGQLFCSFSPAVGDRAGKAMRQKVRHLGLQRLSRYSLGQVATRLNALLDGWIRYFGLFHPSELQRALRSLDLHLLKWAQRKYKRLRGRKTRAWNWLNQLRERAPELFLHWSIGSHTIGR